MASTCVCNSDGRDRAGVPDKRIARAAFCTKKEKGIDLLAERKWYRDERERYRES